MDLRDTYIDISLDMDNSSTVHNDKGRINSIIVVDQHPTHVVLSPLPITRVNCPAMSPSEMGVAVESPSQVGGLWDWKPSEAGSLFAALFVTSDGEMAASGRICAAPGRLWALMGVMMICWSSWRALRRLPPSKISCRESKALVSRYSEVASGLKDGDGVVSGRQ